MRALELREFVLSMLYAQFRMGGAVNIQQTAQGQVVVRGVDHRDGFREKLGEAACGDDVRLAA